MNLLRNLCLKCLTSLLGGGILYAFWLSLFLTLSKLWQPWMEDILWFSAPVLTAGGFALGAFIFDRVSGREANAFLSNYKWSLIGCILGALAVIWFGPMLIVFAMLAAGTVSVALREIVIMQSSADL